MATIKSIKEKAKRYDEAMKAAVIAHKDEDRHLKATLERIFPELKESEKIRNTIFDCLYKCCDSGVITREQRHICIAWLEKQGEKGTNGNEREIPFATWSEEDENIRQWIISDIDKLLALKKKSFIIADKEINWLKFIKDRVQPKQEWSEEDERIYKSIIYSFAHNYPLTVLQQEFVKSLRPQNSSITDEELAQAKKDAYNDALDKIEYHSGEPTFDDGWSAAIWYLKKRNAQPQSQWKPSDEQLDALQYVYRNCNPPISDNLGWDSIRALEMMYQDLKKLKG